MGRVYPWSLGFNEKGDSAAFKGLKRQLIEGEVQLLRPWEQLGAPKHVSPATAFVQLFLSKWNPQNLGPT